MIEPVNSVARTNPRLLQTLQAGRQTSALLSTLPGPKPGFFAAPTTLPGIPRQEALAAPSTGPGAFSLSGERERLNVPLLETLQQGRVGSALLSTIMGTGGRAFPAPVPPSLAGSGPARAARSTGAALPPAGVPLLETEERGRITSSLLSGLAGEGGATAGPLGYTRQPLGSVSGSPLDAMRTAQEIMQTIGMAPPSLQNRRIAAEAYQMEARAQRDLAQRAGGSTNRWQWFA